MNIHLLSGFLGSGKTTAIANAAISLMKEGKRIGVITNDQGKYQVDSTFINSKGVPVVEVSNGCFCCNYESLDEHIINIDKNQSPDYIFAESVGSCTDIVATVLKPLQAYRNNLFDTISLSTFADARMLYQYLQNKKLPFSEDVNYIIQKQYEEADILVVNKVDLIDKKTFQYLKEKVPLAFPKAIILYQNSEDETDVKAWVEQADKTDVSKHRMSLEIDYDTYGNGEAQLGWLDQNLKIEGVKAAKAVNFFTNLMYLKTTENKFSIGHLKFSVDDNETQTWKRSYTSFKKNQIKINSHSSLFNVLVNARIECSPEEIQNVVSESIKETQRVFNVEFTTETQDAFSPGFPKPVHHIA